MAKKKKTKTQPGKSRDDQPVRSESQDQTRFEEERGMVNFLDTGDQDEEALGDQTYAQDIRRRRQQDQEVKDQDESVGTEIGESIEGEDFRQGR